MRRAMLSLQVQQSKGNYVWGGGGGGVNYSFKKQLEIDLNYRLHYSSGGVSDKN